MNRPDANGRSIDPDAGSEEGAITENIEPEVSETPILNVDGNSGASDGNTGTNEPEAAEQVIAESPNSEA